MSKKILYGIIRKKTEKTVTVTVNKKKLNKKYKKINKKKKSYMAENNLKNLKVKDKVYIIEDKPKSKLKKWSVIKI